MTKILNDVLTIDADTQAEVVNKVAEIMRDIFDETAKMDTFVSRH